MSWKIMLPSVAAICLIVGFALSLRACQTAPAPEDYFTAPPAFDPNEPLITPTPLADTDSLLSLDATPRPVPTLADSPRPTRSRPVNPDLFTPTPTPEGASSATDTSPTPEVSVLASQEPAESTPESETGAIADSPVPTPAATPAGVDFTIRIQSTGGDPVEGAEVVFVWRQGGSQMRRIGQTNRAGLFAADGVTTTQLDALTVRKDGFQPASLTGLRPADGAISVTLRPVVVASGAIVGPDGAPWSGEFSLSLYPAASPAGSPAAKRDIQTDDGEFTLPKVAPGEYRAIASAAPGLGAVSETFSMTENGLSSELILRLSGSATAEGRVTASDGQGGTAPLGNARVSARRIADSDKDAAPVLRNATAGADGRFTIDRLPPGLYSFEAASEGAPSRERAGVLVTADGRRDIDITLEQPAIALAIAVSGEDGKPLPQATVLLLAAQGSGVFGSAISDAGGRVEYSGLAPGDYRVAVTHPADASRQKVLVVELRGGGQARLNARFYPRKRIVGAVTRQGRPAPAESVAFVWKRDPQHTVDGGRFVVRIDPATGRFEALLEPGYYEVSVAGAPDRAIQVSDDPDTPAYQFNIALP